MEFNKRDWALTDYLDSRILSRSSDCQENYSDEKQGVSHRWVVQGLPFLLPSIVSFLHLLTFIIKLPLERLDELSARREWQRTYLHEAPMQSTVGEEEHIA